MPRKRRRGGGHPLSPQRKRRRRALRRRFLIVCEGEQTEPNYFRRFRVNISVTVVGTGLAPSGVVQRALQRARGDEFDEIWVVFDKDDFPDTAFNNAIAQAKRAGLQVAYSNPAFELWYLLHFEFRNTALTRRDCQQRLSEHLGRPYRKNDPALYDVLLPYQSTALHHARRLEQQYHEPRNPARENPSTTVHHLVEALIRESR